MKTLLHYKFDVVLLKKHALGPVLRWVTTQVQTSNFFVTVTQNRLSSEGLGTCDEPQVVLVQYVCIYV